jgi:hypothetical protein
MFHKSESNKYNSHAIQAIQNLVKRGLLRGHLFSALLLTMIALPGISSGQNGTGTATTTVTATPTSVTVGGNRRAYCVCPGQQCLCRKSRD